MTEAEWLTETDFTTHVRYAVDHLSPRRQRLLAVGFCRSVAHLFHHPELNAALDVIEQYADGLVSSSEVEKARQHCRDIATESYEEYRVAVDRGIGAQQHGYGRAAFAWAVAYAANSPLPLVEVGTRAAWAADHFDSGRIDRVIFAEGPSGEYMSRMRAVVWEIVGNPFRPVHFNSAWRTDTALSLARHMYDRYEFGAMPILADALQDAGCDNEDVLNHCRDASLTHVRGCWVIDLVLGKE
jgi:hypothetical protein